jgi:hypothetical protein
MANMGYCRFQNTLPDLQNCYEHMEDTNLSKEEERAKNKLLNLCQNIVDEYGDDEDEED